MQGNWNETIITKIAAAVCVAPGKGRMIHNDRPFHGLVINDGGKAADYLFADGTVLHTEDRVVHYLPKGSSYRVNVLSPGSCYAINFDIREPISDAPFALSFRDSDAVLSSFKKAIHAWPAHHAEAMACLYEIIAKILEEHGRNYLPSAREQLLAPALELLHRDFTAPTLAVTDLADACKISAPYFRKLFSHKFGMNPKEYITKLRMEHAGQLLASGEFSVTETAALCGYAEPCHFTREFTKKFGISPAMYKKSSRDSTL